MFKKRISFQISHLKSLLDSETSCVTVVKNFKGNLSLLPFHLGYLKHAVKDLLDNKISKYDPELNGIILGHSNIKVINSLRHSDSGSINLNYIADIYLFTPDVGQKLTGIINKKSKEHIGCLIHSAFNATIPKPRSPGEDLNYWLRIHGSAQIGNELDFTVTKVDFTSRVPYISGLIMKKESDCIEDEVDSGICCQDSTEEGISKMKKKKKKIKIENIECYDNDNPETEHINYHDPSQISELFVEKNKIKTSHKKKRSQHSDILNDSHQIERKTKKIKKEKLSLDSSETEYKKTEHEEADSLAFSIDKIKKERFSLSPEGVTNEPSPQSEKKNSLKIKKIKKEPSLDELTSNLLNDAMEECFSPQSSGASCSTGTDKKRKTKKEKSKHNDSSYDLNSQLQTISPVSSKKFHKHNPDVNTEKQSKKRKRSLSPGPDDVDDFTVLHPKKKKSKRTADLDELTNQLLNESLSNLK